VQHGVGGKFHTQWQLKVSDNGPLCRNVAYLPAVWAVASPASGHVGLELVKNFFSLYVETSCLVCFGTMPNSNSALFVQPYSHWNDTVTGYNGACAKANVVFTARRYSAVFAVVRCPLTWWTNERIRPFVHHVRALYPDGWRYRQIYLSAGSPMILVFDTKRRCSIPKGTPSVGAQNIRGWEKIAILFWNRRLSQKRYKIDP